MEGNVKIIESKAPRPPSRTVSMIRSILYQRRTLGFLLILVGIILIMGVLCFASIENSEIENMPDFDTEISQKEKEQQKPEHVEVQEKVKISLKKQIYTTVRAGQGIYKNYVYQLRTWIPEFTKSKNSGGFSFISDSPLATMFYKDVVVQLNNVEEEDKEVTRLMSSLSEYSKDSRAFWYLSLPMYSYMNVLALPKFAETLNKYNPMQEELYFMNDDKYNRIFLLSRAAVNKILEKNSTIASIKEIIAKKSKPFPNSFLPHHFSYATIRMMYDNNFNDIMKCNDNVKDQIKAKEALIYTCKSNEMEHMFFLKDVDDRFIAGTMNETTVFCFK